MIPTERFRGLEAFVATADAGSFTAAAERLHLTNSAVGKAVARLEQRLATRLFDRTTRRLALTDAGLAFHRTCVRILDELQVAEQVLAADQLEPSGRLRVDVPATFGRMRALPRLLEFVERHPAVRPHISFTDRFVDLIEEGIDVGVRIGGPDTRSPALGHRYLGTERLVFCASPNYLSRRGVPESIDALFTHDAVAYGRADGSTNPWLVARGPGPAERRAVEGRIVLGHADSQVEAVLAGGGVAQLATWLADEHLASGRLIQVVPEAVVDGLALHLVWPRSRQLLPKVDGLLSHLATTLSIR